MQNPRKNKGRLARVLVVIVCCCARVDGLGAGAAMDMQCTDYNLATTAGGQPDYNKPGQASLWSQTKSEGVKVEFNDACGIKIVNEVHSSLISVAWNATVAKGEGYQVTLAFDKDSLGEALHQVLSTGQQFQAGIRFWHLLPPVTCNFTYLTTVFHLQGESLQYGTYGWHETCDHDNGNEPHTDPMQPERYCPSITQDSALPKEMIVYVTPEGNVTNQIKLLNGMELTRTFDYTSTIQGRPPTLISIELMMGQVTTIDFTSFSASIWKPEIKEDTPSLLAECNYASKAKGLLTKYFIALAAGTALVALHIIFAYRLVRNNYWHANKPHPLHLVCTVIAGLDSFGDIAQVCFFWMAYDAAHRVQSVDPQGAKAVKTYHTYWVVSMTFVLAGVVFNAMVLLYVIGKSGRWMNQKLLMQNRLFFALQAALTLTNLELLPLFPWRYEAFQVIDTEDIKDLEGFPSTRIMILSVLPIIFVDLPLIVLQALTQSLDSGFGTDLLISMQVLSALDVVCRFFTRAFITASEVENRRKERSIKERKQWTTSHTTVSTDESLGSPGSVLTGRDSMSPLTIVEGKDMEHVELGQRPASAGATISANDTGFAFKSHPVRVLRKTYSCNM